MGVRGLKRYIENKRGVLRDRNFRDSKLIIDGSNLYHTLYLESCLDQAHGGEYSDYEKVVTQFFTNLHECQIQPYVIIDGGDDISDKKLVTLMQRAEDKFKRADALSKGSSESVLPILTKNVFIQLLKKLQVPHIQCVDEADWEAAALANEWNCPVLSNDTDFYIFDIRGGLLPLSHFEWKRIKNTGQKFIPSKWFSTSNLCAGFNRMNTGLLPIFATILGNDYANLDRGMFPNWAKFSPDRRNHVDGLLTWLSRYSDPENAVQAVLGILTSPVYSGVVREALTQSLQGYRLSSSCIAQFFQSGRPQSKLNEALQKLPEWFMKAMAEGNLNCILLNIFTLQRVILQSSVQDFSLPSSNLTSRSIRQVLYGLMLNNKHGQAAGPNVEEFDRAGRSLVSSKVQAIHQDQPLETLWDSDKTPESWRRQVLLKTLCVSEVPEHLKVPPKLHLAVYVTCYWLKHAKPEPKPEVLWALLINLVYGELSRDQSRHQNKETESVLEVLKGLKDDCRGTRLDLEAAHAYSQWQSSLKDSICLSQLLNNPVPEAEFARLYSGLLVHSVLSKLRRGSTAESLLAGAPEAWRLFSSLRAAVEEEMEEDLIRRMRNM